MGGGRAGGRLGRTGLLSLAGLGPLLESVILGDPSALPPRAWVTGLSPLMDLGCAGLDCHPVVDLGCAGLCHPVMTVTP